MPKSLTALIPDVNSILQLQPEELGGVLIEYLNSLTPQDQQQLNRHNFLSFWGLQGYPKEALGNIQLAFAEAWAWLERECLIAPTPEAGASQSFFITRRGRKLIDRNAYDTYRRATVLPRALLHPRIDARAYPSFMRGAYDTAVFEPFVRLKRLCAKLAVLVPSATDSSLCGMPLGHRTALFTALASSVIPQKLQKSSCLQASC
jgi:hypothetical protein